MWRMLGKSHLVVTTARVKGANSRPGGSISHRVSHVYSSTLSILKYNLQVTKCSSLPRNSLSLGRS